MSNKPKTLLHFLGWLAGFPILILAVAFAVGNRQSVALHWSPLHNPIEAPFCFFILGGLAIGFMAGGLTSWFGAATLRRERREHKRRIKSLEAQLKNAANLNASPQKDFYVLPVPQDAQGSDSS